MEKLLLFPGKTDQGVFTYLIDHERGFLEKTAAEYHPTIAAYINSAKPIKGRTQILVTALGAGEWWGQNVNGDFFPEKSLAYDGPEYGYKTFQTHAKLFKHHVNKDPSASYGDVALSVYNPKYHRVELIISVDNARAPDVVERIENGDYPDLSMGCKVPYDICNLCGNKAPTRKEYCEHLKYYLGRIYPPLGRVAYAINTMPRFFDISVVLIGADKIAKMHKKVAHAQQVMPSSAWLAEKMSEQKEATIEKEVPVEGAPSSQQSLEDMAHGIMEAKSMEKAFPRSTLNTLSKYPLSEVMSTLAMLGVLPKPQEFQRIFLAGQGHHDLADQLDDECACFDPMSVESSPDLEQQLNISHSQFNPFISQVVSPFLRERSYMAPLLGSRLTIMIKRANSEPLPRLIKISAEQAKERKPVGIIPMLALAAGLYAVFGKKAPGAAVTGLDKVLSSNPGLAAALGLGVYATFNSLVKPGAKGDYMDGPRHNPDSNDVFARVEAMKQKPYVKLGSVGTAAKRLLIGVPLAYMASGVLQKHRELNPYDSEGRIKGFVRRNPDVVSGALIADAIMSSGGGGTAGLARKAGNFAKTHFGKVAAALDFLPKEASAQDLLSSALIWPLATGKANLPGKVVSGLFDVAALEAGRQLYLKHTEGKKTRVISS